jgi:hypothetical protein
MLYRIPSSVLNVKSESNKVAFATNILKIVPLKGSCSVQYILALLSSLPGGEAGEDEEHDDDTHQQGQA